MQIAQDHAVLMQYTLTNPEGEVLDSSEGRDPLAYLHGHGNIIPGLEAGLVGMQVGDKKTVQVAAKDGYGETDPALFVTADRSQFPEEAKVEAGVTFQADTPQGPQLVRIAAVNGDAVKVDMNHPLAGVDLTFAVEIMEIRPATAEEIDHGHVHHGDSCH